MSETVERCALAIGLLMDADIIGLLDAHAGEAIRAEARSAAPAYVASFEARIAMQCRAFGVT